ncbi:MAG: substrate-binding domain-containing protein [Acidimicrobiia bacterium]|nr:substrate-binding domain-containing protein [Acidimicrobiia bacterium]
MSSRTLAALICLLVAAGCGGERKKLIGVVPKATSHLFFVSIHAGVDQAAKDFGVEVLWNGPNEETDHPRQIQIVDSMIARRVDAMAISATDERALAAPVERAIKAGIPVTVFDSGVNVEDYVTFVATDNYGAGARAARKLGEMLGGKGKIAMVAHKPGGTSTGLREQGFQDAVQKDVPGLKLVAMQFGMSDRAKSRAAAENMLTAHPDLDGMFASSEASSLGAIQAIQSRGLSGKVKLVTFDFSDIHVEALKSGTIDAMLVQDPYQIGYEAVKSLAEKLKGQAPPKRMDLVAQMILRQDLEKPEIRKLLFPEWLKKP